MKKNVFPESFALLNYLLDSNPPKHWLQSDEKKHQLKEFYKIENTTEQLFKGTVV